MTQDKEDLIKQMAILQGIAIEVTQTMQSSAAADFIFAAIEVINDYPKDGKLVDSPSMSIRDKSEIVRMPFPRPLDAWINARALDIEDYIDWHFAQEKRNKPPKHNDNNLEDLGADIRNKLSRIKNLCAIIKNIPRPIVHDEMIENMIRHNFMDKNKALTLAEALQREYDHKPENSKFGDCNNKHEFPDTIAYLKGGDLPKNYKSNRLLTEIVDDFETYYSAFFI